MTVYIPTYKVLSLYFFFGKLRHNSGKKEGKTESTENF